MKDGKLQKNPKNCLFTEKNRTCCERKKKKKTVENCSWSLFFLPRCLDVKPKKKNHLLASHIVFGLPVWNNISGKEQR